MDKNKQDQPEVTAAQSLFKKADGTEETGKGRGPSIGKKEIIRAIKSRKAKKK